MAAFAYSGRFMYGKTCFGLVGNFSSILKALFAFLADYPEHAKALAKTVKCMKSDSLGRQEIVYFPHVSIPDPRIPNRG